MSPTPVPDACSLSEPEFTDRLSWIRQQLPKARRAQPIEGGMAWEFDADPDLRAKLERLVALESDCCDPERIRFVLHDHPADASLRLEVHGIDADSPLWARIAEPPDGGGLRRFAKAGGLGALGAFGLLCGLPMLLAAVAGAAVAAPLAGLESPVSLAGGSLVLGAVAWWALRRREARG